MNMSECYRCYSTTSVTALIVSNEPVVLIVQFICTYQCIHFVDNCTRLTSGMADCSRGDLTPQHCCMIVQYELRCEIFSVNFVTEVGHFLSNHPSFSYQTKIIVSDVALSIWNLNQNSSSFRKTSLRWESDKMITALNSLSVQSRSVPLDQSDLHHPENRYSDLSNLSRSLSPGQLREFIYFLLFSDHYQHRKFLIWQIFLNSLSCQFRHNCHSYVFIQ